VWRRKEGLPFEPLGQDAPTRSRGFGPGLRPPGRRRSTHWPKHPTAPEICRADAPPAVVIGMASGALALQLFGFRFRIIQHQHPVIVFAVGRRRELALAGDGKLAEDGRLAGARRSWGCLR
jgi:hypothetical protein